MKKSLLVGVLLVVAVVVIGMVYWATNQSSTRSVAVGPETSEAAIVHKHCYETPDHGFIKQTAAVNLIWDTSDGGRISDVLTGGSGTVQATPNGGIVYGYGLFGAETRKLSIIYE